MGVGDAQRSLLASHFLYPEPVSAWRYGGPAVVSKGLHKWCGSTSRQPVVMFLWRVVSFPVPFHSHQNLQTSTKTKGTPFARRTVRATTSSLSFVVAGIRAEAPFDLNRSLLRPLVGMKTNLFSRLHATPRAHYSRVVGRPEVVSTEETTFIKPAPVIRRPSQT